MSGAMGGDLPVFDRGFKAREYLDLFQITSLRVQFAISDDLESVTIQQEICARKSRDGANGWCAALRAPTDVCVFKIDGQEIPSHKVESEGQRYYQVADLSKVVRKIGDSVRFQIETTQRADSPVQERLDQKQRTIFLTRIYGSTCADCEMKVTIPKAFALVRSIPPLQLNKEGYVYRTQVRFLEPVYLALELRRKTTLLPALFGRGAHPGMWAFWSAVIGLLLTILLMILASKKE